MKHKNKLFEDIVIHENFYSPQLKNTRALRVYLPPGYTQQETRRYPVLYMHDGNNLFDDRLSFTGISWNVQGTADAMIIQNVINPLIIVGIDNNAARLDEYGPYQDKHHGGGRGGSYLHFITNTVKPFIDNTYRTIPGREATGLAGSSMGGLITLYASLTCTAIFSNYGVVSPALYWADRALFADLAKYRFPLPVKIWLDAGSAEEVIKDNCNMFSGLLNDCRQLTGLLAESGLQTPHDYVYREYEGAVHHERAWRRRFHEILIYFYGC